MILVTCKHPDDDGPVFSTVAIIGGEGKNMLKLCARAKRDVAFASDVPAASVQIVSIHHIGKEVTTNGPTQ
ncbi:MAG: hypothetical protein P4N59_07310 [Negativicutes bacterium]|nr:hypothetical protein [Negativicutes bacterium]